MKLSENDLMLVTGATGLVGSHVIERAHAEKIRVRALVRSQANTHLLDEWGVEKTMGDMTDPASLKSAVAGATIIVHCAAKVGDWGPVDDYREANVRGLETLLNAAEATGSLRRFVHISSLGVYEARDHHGTDESEAPNTKGIDGYTLTKVEAEQLVLRHIAEKKLPATVLRPGFIYGPRDRTILPRILQRLKDKKFRYLGRGDQLMNNTFVRNLVDAIFVVLADDRSIGEVYNVRDGRLVSKREFIGTIAKLAGYEVPDKELVLPVARLIANVLEKIWKLRGKTEGPVLSNARIKFLGLNLDFSIAKIQRELGYIPKVDFTDAINETIEWFREESIV
ncbi:MAG: NAD-dependent epimerase/dehydratase family protein [Planctomycetaceae bacterium]